MISLAEAVSSRVEEKCVDKYLSQKVIDLRVKIHDEDYINNAVQRIAMVLSRELVRPPEELKLRSKH